MGNCVEDDPLQGTISSTVLDIDQESLVLRYIWYI